MKEGYKVNVAVMLELVLDDNHEYGKRMKYVVTRDPQEAAQSIAHVIDTMLQMENQKAVFAKLNVVNVSNLIPAE